ncbi:MAG: DUF4065 domain-containing protein [Simkania sp.]|nr:DUF4065 domain-containing protein [Simkania sp.]
MKCLKCDKDKFVEKSVRFSPEIKGEVLEVILPCMVCENCETPLVDSHQMNILRRAAADKYREQHNLLTSSQIIAYREELGMSQTAFAGYLNVGEASVKRWETYFIQDLSQDDHIRLKCDEAYAEFNYLNVYWKRHDPDIFSGNRKFNLQLFKQVAIFLVKKTKASIMYLNKLHFYADFLHFKKYGVSLTGVRYIPLKYGPCPDQFRIIYENLVGGGYLAKRNEKSFEALAEPDLSLFDEHELNTLNEIIEIYNSLGVKKIYSLSHKEKGYKETSECKFISYAFAKDLQIS